MIEGFGNGPEALRSPNRPYNFEAAPIDSFEAGLLGGLAYSFCANECPARENIEQSGLACPFLITERSQGDQSSAWNEADRGLQMLGKVAENTWMHCVEDVQQGGEPVILLDLKVDNV